MARDALANDALAAALRSTQSLGQSPIQALAIHPYQPYSGGTYEGGPRQMLPQHTPGPGKGGGGGGSGGGGIGGGLEKLGAGVAQAMKGFAAKSAQQQQFNDMLGGLPGRSTFMSPAARSTSFGDSSSPSPIVGSPLAAPYTPSPIGEAGPLPSFAHGAGTGEMGSSIGSAGSLPSFAVGTPGMPSSPQTAGGGLHGQIAQRIVDYAAQRGVDPYRALGIAAREGLDRANPLASNPDGRIGGVPNTAIGPFQFGTAGLGKDLGITANTPWETQVQKAIDFMASHDRGTVTSMWHSIPDNGGWDAIAGRGRDYADKLGITPGGAAQPSAAMAPAASGAAAYAAKMPSAAESPAATATNLPPQISPGQTQTGPAYSDDTWNNRPQFDFGNGQPQPGPGLINGGQPGVYSAPDLQPPTGPGPQGMNDLPQPTQQELLAMALANNNQFDFGNWGSGFGGGFFG